MPLIGETVVILEFSRNSGIISRAIRWFTGHEWSHVEFVTEDGKYLGSRFFGGVQVRDKPAGDERRRVISDAPYTVVKYAKTQIGKKYDLFAIFGILTRRNWQKMNRWTCSELVAWSFLKANRPLLRSVKAWSISPRDLDMSPLLKDMKTSG